jgi:peptidyl-prolyl cis-trans isomerase B (cyclophilin B)
MRKVLTGLFGVMFALVVFTSSAMAKDYAVIETDFGKIIIEFLPKKAPEHVYNFKKLAKSGFYDGTHFHRVIPGFMIQGGDPNSKSGDRSTHGTGGPGYSVNAEFNDTRHSRGVVSMARSSDPDSAGSQFFIVVKDSPFLDRQYTAFGKVVRGMDAVDKIVAVDRNRNDMPDKDVIMKKVYIKSKKSK